MLGGLLNEVERAFPHFFLDIFQLFSDLLMIGVVDKIDELVIGDVAPILFSKYPVIYIRFKKKD